MTANREPLAADVRVLQQHQLAEGFSGALLQRLAEITHLPTGIASGQIESVEVPAGGSDDRRRLPDDEALLHVVKGHVIVKWGPALRLQTPAASGDTVLVPAGTPFQAENASATGILQFIVVRSA